MVLLRPLIASCLFILLAASLSSAFVSPIDLETRKMDAFLHNNKNQHESPIAATCPRTLDPTKDDDDNLLPLLKCVNPNISSYKNLDTVAQANAEGQRVLVQHKSEDSSELFVKRIQATRYAHKPWADLRRTLLYARTEVRFYSETLPQLPTTLTPTCRLAECHLDGLIPDDEHVLQASAHTHVSMNDLYNLYSHAGGTLILDSIRSDDYYQTSPLRPSQAMQCLRAVAKMHAAAWEKPTLLQHAESRLSKSSFHLRMRNPKELNHMVESWQGFVQNFMHLDPDLFGKAEIQNLGRRVHDMAVKVSQELDVSPHDSYATLVHGDYKAMNVFLPKDETTKHAVMIDFASAGVGLGMADVAMHLIHALAPNYLENDKELVQEYLEELDKARAAVDNNMTPYPTDVAMRHYQLASIDYFRFILGRFWRSATPDSFEEKKNSKNTTLVNRNVEAAFCFIKRTDRFLREFEEEQEQR